MYTLRSFQPLSLFSLILTFSASVFAYNMPRLGTQRKTTQHEAQTTSSISNLEDLKTYYYTQTLDHFNYRPDNYTTFKQRYVINHRYWGGANASAPIFAYLGAEESLEDDLPIIGFLSDNAPRFKALQVYIEHRYYGKSVPFGSMKAALKNESTRGYFNLVQAIADYAAVLLHIKKKLSAENSPVIVVGGSHGGNIVESRPFVSSRKDTSAVNPWVSTKISFWSHFKDYEVFQRLKASAEQHLRVFAHEIVEGSDRGGEEDVSLQLEYQRSQETSTSRCQEEPVLNFRGNSGGGSGRNEGGGEEEEERVGSRGNGSGRRGGGGGDGGGGGGGGGGDGEGSDLESKGGDKKKLRPTLDILKLAIMSIAITAQTSGSAVALQVGGLTFLTKLLLVFVMTSNLLGYLCCMISVLLMHTRPRVARVLGVTGCATTALGFLILIVTFIQGLYNGE